MEVEKAGNYRFPVVCCLIVSALSGRPLHTTTQDTVCNCQPTTAEMNNFMAGIVYIISQVFKRGIEIQEENH